MLVVKKDNIALLFIMAVMITVAIFPHIYAVWLDGFSIAVLKLCLLVSPISFLFVFFGFKISKAINNRIVFTDSGLLVEDFSHVEFPWNRIRRASVKLQRLPRGGECQWLVLSTEDDSEYASKSVRKLNGILGINGIPVCNLAMYKEHTGEIVRAINSRARCS